MQALLWVHARGAEAPPGPTWAWYQRSQEKTCCLSVEFLFLQLSTSFIDWHYFCHPFCFVFVYCHIYVCICICVCVCVITYIKVIFSLFIWVICWHFSVKSFSLVIFNPQLHKYVLIPICKHQNINKGQPQCLFYIIINNTVVYFLLCRNKFVEFDMKPVCKKCYEKFPLELKKRLKKLAESLGRK